MTSRCEAVRTKRRDDEPTDRRGAGLLLAWSFALTIPLAPGFGPLHAPPGPIDVDAVPVAVTVYPDRARVSRVVTRALAPGIHEIRFAALPESVLPDTLQARTTGPARVLRVDTVALDAADVASPRIAELDRELDGVRDELEARGDEAEVVRAEEAFLEAITARAAAEAGAAGGTRGLDLAAVREQLAFVAAERRRLVERRQAVRAEERKLGRTLARLEAERAVLAGAEGVHRTAILTLAVDSESPVTIDLSYLVTGATWRPQYTIRSTADASTVRIEYDAVITQRTGEDWTDVVLTLSTAEPPLSAHPPTLEPWFVDVVPRADSARGRSGAETDASVDIPPEVVALPAPRTGGRGPSVSYRLDRRVNVPSQAARQSRTRILTIDAAVEFTHVAVPLLTEAVYVRGEITNTSPHLLLSGPASIFVGEDFVGATRIGAVADYGSFVVYFGVDPAITATRTLLEKTTTKTGLLGGGRRTNYEYRIDIQNHAARPILLELWERIPVSRTNEVRIEIQDPTHPLAADALYLERDRPRGLLKWVLAVPAAPAGPGLVLGYGVRVVRAKDVETTGLP